MPEAVEVPVGNARQVRLTARISAHVGTANPVTAGLAVRREPAKVRSRFLQNPQETLNVNVVTYPQATNRSDLDHLAEVLVTEDPAPSSAPTHPSLQVQVRAGRC
jgi:hypothetical protein